MLSCSREYYGSSVYIAPMKMNKFIKVGGSLLMGQSPQITFQITVFVIKQTLQCI